MQPRPTAVAKGDASKLQRFFGFPIESRVLWPRSCSSQFTPDALCSGADNGRVQVPAKNKRKRSSARAKTAGGDRTRLSDKSPRASIAIDPAPAKPSARRKAPAAAAIANVTRIADLGKVWERIGKIREPAEFRVSCIRPDDLLVCEFVFDNLRLGTAGDGAPKLVRKDPAAAATLIVEFPPQSFGEEAFLDSTGPEVASNPTGNDKFPETSSAVDAKNVATPGAPLPPMPSARIRMAGRSRIAFAMPAEEAELAFAIEAILDACRRWPMRLDVNAVADPPSFRLPGFAIRDEWLASVVASP